MAILSHPTREDAWQMALETSRWLAGQGHRFRLLRLTNQDRVVEDGRETDLSELCFDHVDVAVSLGGDGTLLRLAPLVAGADVPIIGVNFGRLGYLLQLRPEELAPVLVDALGGRARIEERAAVTVRLDAGRSWFALNEVVLEKTVYGHTVRLATAIDGEPFLKYSADGLIIATPTGSTAYNLSAGGPVMSPRLRAMVMTPVAPHLSLDRSLVLHAGQVVRVEIAEGPPAVLVVDGTEVARLDPGTGLSCAVADRPLRLVSNNGPGFASLLAASLAEDPRP
ncbi:MAG TPA: NAD(+)/NADH kinase [Acidimicrobiales bacterium]